MFLAAVLILGMQSTVFASTTTDLSETSQSGNVTVTGTVEEPASPTYVITIPASIDFGTLEAPDTDEDDYKSVTFDVTASSFANFSSGTGVAVLVKDSNDEKNNVGDWGAKFYITNEDSISLEYSILDPDGDDISAGDLTRESGLLYYVFDAASVTGSSDSSMTVTGTAMLNQRQLYGLDLEDEDSAYLGDYEGTLNFYVRVVYMSDYS